MSARLAKPVVVLIFLSLIATLVGALKFSSCEQSFWATPDQYVHACYSDIPALYGERELDDDRWCIHRLPMRWSIQCLLEL